jgi:hypothetical protein
MGSEAVPSGLFVPIPHATHEIIHVYRKMIHIATITAKQTLGV